ncbi:DUF2195 family protein [Ochrobactrum vermis]|uniref:DUF2195 family protein n=1 Tax=Ochrobactrum vermis TaxID=1827297 RepID=A0ABU8PM32_9HYPH|nr:DUF2195 family protein [Ochrobactrum vermis]PQZ24472.1 hypothetical protein CQZ93_26065 [Ochrobactrum vermis]
MPRIIYGVVLSAWFCGIAVAEDVPGIAFENKLAACVTVTGEKSVVKANVLSVKAHFQIHKPIGDCGCFSARVAYSSSIDMEGVPEFLQQGIIPINKDAVKTLVLASEASLVGDREINVQLVCARPT